MDPSPSHEFEDRLRRIEEARVRAALVRPPVALGASLARPWRRTEIGLKLAGMAAAAVIGLKAALMLDIGADAYDQHRAALEQGPLIDQFAAMLMRPDPVTMLLRSTAHSAVDQAAAAQAKLEAVESTAASAQSENPTSAPTSLNFNPAPTGVRMSPAPTARQVTAAPQQVATAGGKPAAPGGAIRGGITFVHAPVQGGAMTMAGVGRGGKVTHGKAGMFVLAPLPTPAGPSP